MVFNMECFYHVYDSLPEQFNLIDYLFSSIKPNEFNRVAYITGGSHISYGELIQRVKQFSCLLKNLGVEQESRVVILLSDDINFVYAFLAIIWLGGIAVIINEAHSDHDIEYVLSDCRANFIVSRNLWHSKFKSEIYDKMYWVLIDEPGFDQQLARQLLIERPVLVAREAEAFWVYTSGSMGQPKGVIHLHYNPVVAIQNYGRDILKLAPDDVIFSAPSMSFSYGLGTSIYFPLFFHASVVISPNSSPFEHINIITNHAVTVFFGIPHTYASIYAIKEILSLQADSLRLCVSAGEQLPIPLWRKWHDHYGVSICEGIGTTESTHIFISNSVNNTVAGSTGRAVSGYQIRLVNDNAKEVAAGEPGLLEVSGEGFMQGYWQKLKATQQVLRGQTMITGDIYRCDELGNYYFIGRKDSLVKVKGMWLIPAEIEQVFLQHPLLVEIAVIVKPGIIEDTAEIVAYIQLKEGYKFTRELRNEIIKLANSQLPKFKIPRKILALNKLPRNVTGKIHRKRLADDLSLQKEKL